MKRIKIGVDLGSAGVGVRQGLDQAERMGVSGVQLDAAGDLTPRSLSQTGRRELIHLLRSHNLELAALGCPLRHDLDKAEGQDARIEHVCQVMSLSFDLGARRVVVQPGRIPEASESTRTRLLTEALLALGHYGDRTGTVLAIESGLEKGEMLKSFIEQFDTGGLGVCLDPANFLISGLDPYQNARDLTTRVVYCQAKDARASGPNRAAQEVPLGHGNLDWMQFLSVLEEIDYRGWLTVKRESGSNRLGDITAGVQFLRRFVGPA
jgi:sugar phosphate isomerase/epimerase